MEEHRAKIPPPNGARDCRVLHYISEIYWHIDIVIGCLNEMDIFSLLPSKAAFRLLQNIAVLLSILHMPAGCLAVLSQNVKSKQTSMLV